MRARGGTAVMAARTSVIDALDYFPTPPWASRALVADVLHCFLHPPCGFWSHSKATGTRHLRLSPARNRRATHSVDKVVDSAQGLKHTVKKRAGSEALGQGARLAGGDLAGLGVGLDTE